MRWKGVVSAALLLVGYPAAIGYALHLGGNQASIATLSPVAIYCALLAIFGATLRPGKVPLIRRFAQMEQGELTPELLRYTRRLTEVWCIFFAVMAILALALRAWASTEIWFMHTFFFSYLLIGALFAGEYVYRRWRYPHYRHANPLVLLRNIHRRGLR